MDPQNRSDPDTLCSWRGCDNEAAYYAYDADSEEWQPICYRHAQNRHPSLEIHAWLESGYMKPAELGKPHGPPVPPPRGRPVAFRREIEELMGWTN